MLACAGTSALPARDERSCQGRRCRGGQAHSWLELLGPSPYGAPDAQGSVRAQKPDVALYCAIGQVGWEERVAHPCNGSK